MSDLQCPARVLFAGAGGEERLRRAVGTERVSAVWSGTTLDPSGADRVAAELHLSVRSDPRLDPRTDTEPEAAAVERVSRLVQEVSDLGRGETSLLIADPELIGLAVRRLCSTIPSVDVIARPLQPGGTVLVEVDSAGWSCAAWPSETRP